MEEKINEYKEKIEAILFVAGKRLSLNEIARLARIRDKDNLKIALYDLKKKYEEKGGSLIIDVIEQDGETLWKLTVKNQMIPLIKRIVTKTELKKSVIETLAYIAYKYPIKQSDLIKVRSNKAYDHLKELENAGYISRQRYGRTNTIKLTDRFFDYFDLPPEKLKEQFKDFAQLEKVIEEKEVEVEKMKKEHREKTEEIKKKRQKETEEGETLEPDLDQIEIDLINDEGHREKLKQYEEGKDEEGKISEIKTYEGTPSGEVEVIDKKEAEISEVEEKLGDLDVIDEPLPELAEQIKKKEKKHKHVGELEVFGDEVEAEEEPGEKKAEKVEEAEEVPAEAEEIEEAPVEEAEKAEPEFEKETPPKEKELTIEEEILKQKEELEPEKNADFGEGFEKEVKDYMEKKADERVEEIMHPEKESGKKEEDITDRIKIPPMHGKEETKEETPAEPEEEKAEKKPEENGDFIEKKKSILRSKDEEKIAELPPMDTFEKETEEETKPEDEEKEK